MVFVSANRQWRGLSALVRDLVVHGSKAVETIQRETIRRPIALIGKLAPAAVPLTKTIGWVHDVAVSATHKSIRGVARVLDVAVEAGLDARDDATGSRPGKTDQS